MTTWTAWTTILAQKSVGWMQGAASSLKSASMLFPMERATCTTIPVAASVETESKTGKALPPLEIGRDRKRSWPKVNCGAAVCGDRG